MSNGVNGHVTPARTRLLDAKTVALEVAACRLRASQAAARIGGSGAADVFERYSEEVRGNR